MWEFIKANPWMFIAGSAICIVAIAGVVYGVLAKGGWFDRGLMIRDGHKLKWDPRCFPLAVWLHPDLPIFWRQAFIQSRCMINTSAVNIIFNHGVEAPTEFSFDRLADGHIGIVPKDAAGFMQQDTATTDLKYDKRNGRIQSVVVSVPVPCDSAKAQIMLDHEILHVLGFDHDEHIGSIMHPQLQYRAQEMTDRDVKLLRSLYRLKTKG